MKRLMFIVACDFPEFVSVYVADRLFWELCYHLCYCTPPFFIGLSSQPPAEYPNCSYHQNMVMSLTSIVQSITLHCPTALLWMPSAASESSVSQSGPSSVGSNSGKGDEENLNGWSPLDQLPYAPSELPLSSRLNPELTEQVSRRQI